MGEDVAVVGVGWYGFRRAIHELSYKEMMFKAAARAYEDAEVNPRRDIDAFIAASEDFHEGISIFEEYIPDQLGATQKPVNMVAADGLHALINAYMLIRTGMFDVVAVEAHGKPSEIVNYPRILSYALDPFYHRHLGFHPYYVAGLEMTRYMMKTKTSEDHIADVAVKNKANALLNSRAAHGAKLTVKDVLSSEPIASPLRSLMVSPPCDGAIVMVLASDKKAKEMGDNPLWIRGVGWSSGSPWIEDRNMADADYVGEASRMSYKMAKISRPHREIDLAEVDDTFAYKELQHMEALGFCRKGEASKLTATGTTAIDGGLPVNPSGGSLGVGHCLEATGLQRALEVILQLRGEAGGCQVKRARTGLVQCWRGIPTASGAVAIFSVD